MWDRRGDQGASGNWDMIRGGWPKVTETLVMWELSKPELVMGETDGIYIRIPGT